MGQAGSCFYGVSFVVVAIYSVHTPVARSLASEGNTGHASCAGWYGFDRDLSRYKTGLEPYIQNMIIRKLPIYLDT